MKIPVIVNNRKYRTLEMICAISSIVLVCTSCIAALCDAPKLIVIILISPAPLLAWLGPYFGYKSEKVVWKDL